MMSGFAFGRSHGKTDWGRRNYISKLFPPKPFHHSFRIQAPAHYLYKKQIQPEKLKLKGDLCLPTAGV